MSLINLNSVLRNFARTSMLYKIRKNNVANWQDYFFLLAGSRRCFIVNFCSVHLSVFFSYYDLHLTGDSFKLYYFCLLWQYNMSIVYTHIMFTIFVALIYPILITFADTSLRGFFTDFSTKGGVSLFCRIRVASPVYPFQPVYDSRESHSYSVFMLTSLGCYLD